ncbi:MAG: hypothetical protein Q7J27_14105 [Syntrophales bacterium]|nr:hypothetical protein [Syntrophales bacterium]
MGGGIHVTHTYTDLPTGVIAVGELVVELGEDGKESKIQIVRFGNNGHNATEFISITELSNIPSGRPELQYGVCTDNKLIL